MPTVRGCVILEVPSNTSDHMPIKTSISLDLDNSSTAVDSIKEYPNTGMICPSIDWSNMEITKQYQSNIAKAANQIKPVMLNGIIDKSHATLSDSLSDIIHRSCKNIQKCLTYKGSYSQKHWWNNDCDTAKIRVKSCGKPREGHVYLSYKCTKKTYRKLFKDGMDTNKTIIENLYVHNRTEKLWNVIRHVKLHTNSSVTDISLFCLEEYYKKTFSDTNAKGSYIQVCTSTDMSKYSKIWLWIKCTAQRKDLLDLLNL